MRMKELNNWAWRSTSRGNKNRLSRVYYRCLYRMVAWQYRQGWEYWTALAMSRGGCAVDTYPMPYADPHFAPWPEEDGTLISDAAGFVIRHSTSYCAHKFREVTGRWPRHGRGERYDAKDWWALLSMNGCEAAERFPKDGQHYIGIAAEIGEYGLVVWFERNEGPLVVYSTYQEGRFLVSRDVPSRFTWVRILGRGEEP